MTDPRVTGPRLNVRFALFALSANQCAFPGCDALMFSDGSILGEICHIHSQSPGGPRYRADLSSESVHGIENLILLCQKHHKIVDDHPYEYDAQRMKAMKGGAGERNRGGNTKLDASPLNRGTGA